MRCQNLARSDQAKVNCRPFADEAMSVYSPATVSGDRRLPSLRLVRLYVLIALGSSGFWCSASVWGQDLEAFEGRIIDRVEIEGLSRVSRQYVENQIRSGQGRDKSLSLQLLHQDNVRLTHLGRFASIRNRVEPLPNNHIVLIFVVKEYPLLADVQVVGNRLISVSSSGEPFGAISSPSVVRQGMKRSSFAVSDPMRASRPSDVTLTALVRNSDGTSDL